MNKEEIADKCLINNEIYKNLRLKILNSQRKQILKGLSKYPEPLNDDSWTIIETIDHMIEELIDALHYVTMLKIKLEKEIIKDMEE